MKVGMTMKEYENLQSYKSLYESACENRKLERDALIHKFQKEIRRLKEKCGEQIETTDELKRHDYIVDYLSE